MEIRVARVADRWIRRQVEAAYYVGYRPMDTDEAHDLLDRVEKMDPRKAAKLVEKALKSRDFGTRYAAMGVWDVVVSSGVAPYQMTFDFLGPDVAMAARKGIPPEEGDEWADSKEVDYWIRFYQKGRASGKHSARFQPRTLGPTWVLIYSNAYGDDPVEVSATVKNRWTGEKKRIETDLNGPEAYLENVWTEDFGGEHTKQQSVLLTAEGEDMSQWQTQLEIDEETGEWDQRSVDRAVWDLDSGY